MTLTLDELELNAVRAALGDRLAKMGRQLADLRELRDSPENARAVAWTQDAIRDATRAQVAIDTLIATAIPAHLGRWVRRDDTVAHLFDDDGMWMRSLCRTVRWTAVLRKPHESVPTCADCAAAALVAA